MNEQTNIYLLTDEDMQKIDALISELQCVYCDIYSNREVSLTPRQRQTSPTANRAQSENKIAID